MGSIHLNKMVQGKLKVKAKLPGGAKVKSGQKRKQLGPRKGARKIAPKKTKIIEASKLKKGLEKAIKSDIEHEVSMKAKSLEPRSFSVVKSATNTGESAGQGTSKSSKTNKK